MDGKRLKYKIQESGFSSTELANKLNLSNAASISSFFTRNDIRTSTLEKIAEAIGKPVAWFYEDYPEVTPEQYKSLIKKHGYTLESLATRMGSSLSSLQYKLRYYAVPYYVLEQTAIILGIEIEHFWGGKNKKEVSINELVERLTQTIATQNEIINNQANSLTDLVRLSQYATNTMEDINKRLDILESMLALDAQKGNAGA